MSRRLVLAFAASAPAVAIAAGCSMPTAGQAPAEVGGDSAELRILDGN